ncbi:uncharacterized protein LOC124542568 [Vanessa cardui]|uniref:uncharacterized protein LOC124542568 n=1 Tax=Vanessa cardui TaxID=171605 RepID=UPI001F138DD7|nr:uncharacterized protein LOC124542568 [Vanessa cardui]
MEAIKQSIEELSLHFNTKMAEFQHNLQTAIPATSPTSNIAAQFTTFRNFVLSALESLQLQLSVLTKQHDLLEMRSRKKILLIHGIPESTSENVTVTAVKMLSQHIKMPELVPAAIRRSHRIGRPTKDKPRPILIKFQDLSLRNKVWYGKASLKNTGITLSEFLTKSRHEAFMVARQQFGVSNCWTKEGQIFIIGPGGVRHRITSTAELGSISNQLEPDNPAVVATAGTSNQSPNHNTKGKTVQSLQTTRPKRNLRK